MRHIILWIGLLLSLTACQLSLDSSPDDVATPLPVITQKPSVVTSTPLTVQTPTPTRQTTNTPPKINTSVPLPSCQRRTNWPTYSVVAGDTLGKIANRTASDVATLVAANCLANADQISVGQTLYVPQAPTPPTQTPVVVDNGFVVSSLPANAQCYYQVQGIPGSANVRGAPDNASNILTTITTQFYYRIYSQTTTHYEITYSKHGETGWVEKLFGTPVGDCHVLTNAPSNIVTTHYNGIALDHPSNWYSGFNIDGLLGGYMGTIRTSEMPTTINGWNSNMVVVSYTIVPDGIIGPNLEIAAKEAVENLRQSGRFSIAREATAIKTVSGYEGFFYDYTDTSAYYRVYNLRVGSQNVVFMIQGNITLGDSVVNTVRAE
jgi:LysM repeat protein